MSLLSRIFGGSKPAAAPEPEVYKGFKIFAEPMAEGGKFRLAARIEREVEGTLKSTQVIRADTFDNRDMAVTASAAKARQVIDESGETLF